MYICIVKLQNICIYIVIYVNIIYIYICIYIYVYMYITCFRTYKIKITYASVSALSVYIIYEQYNFTFLIFARHFCTWIFKFGTRISSWAKQLNAFKPVQEDFVSDSDDGEELLRGSSPQLREKKKTQRKREIWSKQKIEKTWRHGTWRHLYQDGECTVSIGLVYCLGCPPQSQKESCG